MGRKKKPADAVPTPEADQPAKNPHAQALGKLGGLKGGKARAAKLTSEQRAEIAKRAVAARWGKKKDSQTATIRKISLAKHPLRLIMGEWEEADGQVR